MSYITQFDDVANASYPGVYGRFLDSVAAVISFDLGFVLSAGCLVDVDFHDRLLMTTIAPLLVLVALGCTYLVAIWRNGSSEEVLRAMRKKHGSMVVLVTVLVYSSVSSTIFQTLVCEELEDANVGGSRIKGRVY